MLDRLFRALPRPLRPLAVSLYDAFTGVNRYDIPRQEIRGELQAEVILLPDRNTLLERLPKHGCVAELGVDRGDFSKEILRIAQPKKLYLVDRWGDSRYSLQKRKRVAQDFATEIENDEVVLINADSLLAAKQFEALS